MKSRISQNKIWKWYVYIIECNDGSFYTGMTWNPAVRGEQHQSSFGGKYTKDHGYRKMAYIEEHNDIGVARERERQIKDWNRQKKLKLISGEWSGNW